MKKSWRTLPLLTLVGLTGIPFWGHGEDEGKPSVNPLEQRAEELVEILRTRERDIDPFGIAMNPNEKGDLLMPELPAVAEPEEVRSTLREALSKLVVNGVNPRSKTVLIGFRRLQVGDRFVIQHQALVLRLALRSVSADRIELVDLDTGEIAEHFLRIVPNLGGGRSKSGLSQYQTRQHTLTIR